jgi:hypothetical protein
MIIGPMAVEGQSLMDPRVVGLGAYTPAVKDSRGFGWNPGGLTQIRDWDFSVSTYTGVSSGNKGFVFHGLTLGKRFMDNEALAIEYSPGTRLRLVVPPTLSISGIDAPASNDREIEYSEQGSMGFAHRFSQDLSVGVAGRHRLERITDTRISLVPRDSILLMPVSSQIEYEARTWLIDLGILWTPFQFLSLGATGKNLVRIRDAILPDSLDRLTLPWEPIASLGAVYRFSPEYRVALSVSTDGQGMMGHEWAPGLGIAVRNALYVDSHESPAISAVSLGLGWSYEFVEVGASYLRFTNRTRHSGIISLSDFDAKAVHSLDLNPYVRDRVSLSVKAIFGDIRESLARIEQVEMYGAVYPSSFELFAYRPIGKARVRNVSSKRIQARVSFFVDRFMDVPTESPSFTIEPGEVAEAELTAVFNERVKSVSKMTIRDADIYVTAAPAEAYDDRAQARVLFRGKNDWDGDARSLRFFVTPDDPDILRTSRDILLQNKEGLSVGAGDLDSFRKARVLINGFAGKLMYVSDPKLTADFVQYPSETLKIRGGDCDDMTVCFASLLSSVGISTAFVDVVPPASPERSHIYLLFDSGLKPEFGDGISDNPKRYVVRKGRNGTETIWIPIEPTVVARGFEEAWTAGAQEYFDEVQLGLGLAKGWVRILDVN